MRVAQTMIEDGILSGPFAGETIVREPETGYLYHQWVAYKPATPDSGTE